MKVLILGGGLAGCVTSYLLKKRGYETVIVEEREDIGGVCQTYEMGGISYEFGPHFLYGDGREKEFFEEHLTNRLYKIQPKVCIGDNPFETYDFPVSFETINNLPPDVRLDIFDEIYRLESSKEDFTNFETYMLTRVGRTIYDKFIKNYNIKQWGVRPSDLDVGWAKFRPFKIGKHSVGRFGDKWQGHPGTYRKFFKKMTEDTEIIRAEVKGLIKEGNTVSGAEIVKDGRKEQLKGDLVISTLPIDTMMECEGRLSQRNTVKLFLLLNTEYAFNHMWTTFPNEYSFLRVFEYKRETLQKHENTLISFSFQTSGEPENIDHYMKEVEPFLKKHIKADVLDSRLGFWKGTYPLPTLENERKFSDLIESASELNNFVTLGRQGLFSYISMDTCVGHCLRLNDNLDSFINNRTDEKLAFYKEVRKVMS